MKIYRNLLLSKTTGFGRRSDTYHMLLVQLIKVCNHPYLFDGVEEQDAPLLGDHLINTCGKMMVLDKLLVKLFEGKH